MHFAAETHVDRSILSAGDFIRTDVYGTFVLLEAARERRARAASCRSRPTRSTAASPEGASRETRRAATRAIPTRRARRAPTAGLQLLGHLRRAGDHHARVNNYGPYQFPGEGHPALRHQRDRRPAAAALRRRPERARLAHVLDHCRGDRPPDRARGRTARSTTSAAATSAERRPHPPDPRAARQAGEPHHAGRRPARPRPPLRARHRASSRALGWAPAATFDDALAATVEWYRTHDAWWRPIKSGAFRQYYQAQYTAR